LFEEPTTKAKKQTHDASAPVLSNTTVWQANPQEASINKKVASTVEIPATKPPLLQSYNIIPNASSHFIQPDLIDGVSTKQPVTTQPHQTSTVLLIAPRQKFNQEMDSKKGLFTENNTPVVAPPSDDRKTPSVIPSSSSTLINSESSINSPSGYKHQTTPLSTNHLDPQKETELQLPMANVHKLFTKYN